MTPELIARFRSEDDDIAEAAAAEWERRGEKYRTRLQAIRGELPKSVRRLLGRHALHDARVLAIAADANPHFSIFLELENPADPRDRRLELRYRLAGGMRKGLRLVKHSALAGDGKPLAWWLYDEFDVSEGPVPAFTHSILLTGGYEFQLTFFALSCRRLNLLFPAVNAEGEVDIREVENLVRPVSER